MAKFLHEEQKTLFGHPTGLYTLFFAELWERFSYYGMRALLILYLTKGFLGYGDSNAYTIYGAYTALVYMTPFFGGMIADRLIGARRAVILGGLFMAGGHLMMTVGDSFAFFTALALLIIGNGFFKPNISTMVGSLYPSGSPKRDGGFTIFYIGINLGAAIAPLLCGYVGETFGWHKGFGLATVGMLTGLAVFVAPTVISQALLLLSCLAASLNIIDLPFLSPIHEYLNWIVAGTMILAGIAAFTSLNQRQVKDKLEVGFISNLLTQALILLGAGGIAVAMVLYHPEDFFTTMIFYLMAVVLVAAAIVAVLALSRAPLPAAVGLPADFERLRSKTLGIGNDWLVYILAIVSVPVFTMLVSGFEPVFGTSGGISLIPETIINSLKDSESAGVQVLGTVTEKSSTPAGLILILSGLVCVIYLFSQIFRMATIARHRMYVVMVLTFFSMLFWSFFEQAGSSVNNFTDRNVSRVVTSDKVIQADDVNKEIKLRIPVTTNNEELKDLPLLTQEFLGRTNDNPEMKDLIAKAMRRVERAKIENRQEDVEYDPAADRAANELVAEAWEQMRSSVPPTPADFDEQLPRERIDQLEQQEEEWEQDVEQLVTELFNESSVLQAEDDQARQQRIDQLVERVKFEKTIQTVLESSKLNMTALTYLRDYAISDVIDAPLEDKMVTWIYAEDNVGMEVGGSEIPASVFQSINPIFILIFGLLFTLLWGFLSRRGLEPSTPVKFAWGLIQLGLGFACFWYGAVSADEHGMVTLVWLFLGYLFQTTGELCLSPVGLSMVTKLSPARLVSTVMGTWFLATAFSQFLAAIIAQFSGVSEGGDEAVIPVPSESVDVYGGVFGAIAGTAVASGLVCLVLSPILKKWMHIGEESEEDKLAKGG